MNARDVINLQEAYLEVYNPERFESESEEYDDLDEAMTSYERNRQRAAQRAAARNEARRQGKTGNVPGVGYVSSRPERETWTDEAGRSRHKTGARMPQNEEYEDYDVYDVVLSHLLDEGYADSVESAETIMVNMSEDWRDSILEDLINEISLKTKMAAYAATQDPSADYSYGDKVHDQGERIHNAIVKKHGPKAGEHADAHAYSQHFGRTDSRTGRRQQRPVPRSSSFSGRSLESPKRTTKSGKMHKTDQASLKAKLQNRRTSRRQGESSVTDHPSFYNR